MLHKILHSPWPNTNDKWLGEWMDGWILHKKRCVFNSYHKFHSIPFCLASSIIITLIYKLHPKVEEFIPHSSVQVKLAVRAALISAQIKCVLSSFSWRQGAIKLSSVQPLNTWGSPPNTIWLQPPHDSTGKDMTWWFAGLGCHVWPNLELCGL